MIKLDLAPAAKLDGKRELINDLKKAKALAQEINRQADLIIDMSKKQSPVLLVA